jgi:hypothetical protein
VSEPETSENVLSPFWGITNMFIENRGRVTTAIPKSCVESKSGNRIFHKFIEVQALLLWAQAELFCDRLIDRSTVFGQSFFSVHVKAQL